MGAGYKIPTLSAWPIILPNATSFSDGVMSFADKIALDALVAGGGSSPNAGLVANVVSFGAKGNGIADDAPAIQAALDSIRDVGGIVYFPPGGYRCMSAVSALATVSHTYNNITLLGAGYSSHLFAGVPIGKHDGSFPYSLLNVVGRTAYGLTNFNIRSMRISGFDRTTLAGPIVQFVNVNGVTIIDSFWDTAPCEGIASTNPNNDKNIAFINCYATQIGGYGVTPALEPTSAYNPAANDTFIIGCKSFQCGLGVEWTGAGLIIAGSIFDTTAVGPTPGQGWEYALSLASTAAGSRINVYGNTVRFAGQGLAISTTAGSGTSLVDKNIFENVDACVTVNNALSPVAVRGNSFYDVATPGNGAGQVVRHGPGPNAQPITVEHNLIVAGPTGKWAYGVLIDNAIVNDVVRKNTVIGDGFDTAVFVAAPTSTGWNAQFIDNVIIPLTMNVNVPRYNWNGRLFSKANLSGVDNGATFATLRPSRVRHSAAPTVGTWSVGDVCVNTAPAANGILQWICTAAGSPGTWTPMTLS